eukprot:scaffold4498_cov117-Cylindrotheca_fusiformis.AAC.2
MCLLNDAPDQTAMSQIFFIGIICAVQICEFSDHFKKLTPEETKSWVDAATRPSAILFLDVNITLDPSLRQILKFFLSATDPTNSYNLDDLLPQYRHLHRAQLALGKTAVFRGFFHKDWVILQKA